MDILTHKIKIPDGLGTTHCGRDCAICSLLPYPSTRWCSREKGVIYTVEGECNRCGICCPGCNHLYEVDEKVYHCRIYEDRNHACTEFPSVQDFLEGNVPEECSYILKKRPIREI